MTRGEAVDRVIELCVECEKEYGPGTIDGVAVTPKQEARLVLAALGVGPEELERMRPWLLGLDDEEPSESGGEPCHQK